MPQRKHPPKHPHAEEVRLQTFLARAGVASRRHSEELIAQGRVFVNGASVTAPGTKVRPGVDRVEVNGEPVEVQPTTWIALHKPRGYVTTRHDPYQRRTIYDLLPDRYHGLFHVGRLDRDSEGVLLLTNDGETANRMLHPSFGMTKEYHADVEGKATSEQLHRLTEGVEVDGQMLTAESVRRLHQVDENVFRLEIVLREGKKREIRRMLEAVGHPVKRLIRRRFGPVALGELPSGKYRVVTPVELAAIGKKSASAPRSKPAAEDADAPRPRREARSESRSGGRSKAGSNGRSGSAPRPRRDEEAPRPRAGSKPSARPKPHRDDDAPQPRSASKSRPHADPRGPKPESRSGAGPRSRPDARGAKSRPSESRSERYDARGPKSRPGLESRSDHHDARGPNPRAEFGSKPRQGPDSRGPKSRPGSESRSESRHDTRGPKARPGSESRSESRHDARGPKSRPGSESRSESRPGSRGPGSRPDFGSKPKSRPDSRGPKSGPRSEPRSGPRDEPRGSKPGAPSRSSAKPGGAPKHGAKPRKFTPKPGGRPKNPRDRD